MGLTLRERAYLQTVMHGGTRCGSPRCAGLSDRFADVWKPLVARGLIEPAPCDDSWFLVHPQVTRLGAEMYAQARKDVAVAERIDFYSGNPCLMTVVDGHAAAVPLCFGLEAARLDAKNWTSLAVDEMNRRFLRRDASGCLVSRVLPRLIA
jgi:hypothetical protein